MKRLAPTALVALLFSSALVGCASAPAPLASPAGKAARAASAAPGTGSDVSPKATSAPLEAPPAPGRNPGDFITYRFTGKLIGGTVTLTEKVLSRDLGRIVVEVHMASKKLDERLVVTFVDLPTGRGDVLEVSSIDAEGNRAARTIAEYEALMAKVAPAADSNEELLGTDESPRNIGGVDVDAKVQSFRVLVKGKKAVLRTVESNAIAWGDLGGEITAEDGATLYRAEVLEMGKKDVASEAAGVAKNDAY